MKQSALWSTIGTPTLLVSVGLAHAYPNYFCITMMTVQFKTFVSVLVFGFRLVLCIIKYCTYLVHDSDKLILWGSGCKISIAM